MCFPFSKQLFYEVDNSNHYLQKARTLTHSEETWRGLFPTFKVVAAPHWPLQSENLPFHSEAGSFHASKTTQLQSCSKQANPMLVTLIIAKIMLSVIKYGSNNVNEYNIDNNRGCSY